MGRRVKNRASGPIPVIPIPPPIVRNSRSIAQRVMPTATPMGTTTGTAMALTTGPTEGMERPWP